MEFFCLGKVCALLTNSFSEDCFFFPGPEKKKTGFFLTNAIFSKNCKKLSFSQEKKYGTYADRDSTKLNLFNPSGKKSIKIDRNWKVEMICSQKM